MEDFLSVVIFVIVAVVSVVSKIKKSAGGSDSAADTSLSEAMSAMKQEISNSSSTESSSYSYDNESSYDTAESYDTLDTYDSLPSYEEQVETVTENLLNEGAANNPGYVKKNNKNRDDIRKRLRELTVWKEVLDKPVSMR